MCVTTAYGVQCLVAGCRGSGAGQQALSRKRDVAQLQLGVRSRAAGSVSRKQDVA